MIVDSLKFSLNVSAGFERELKLAVKTSGQHFRNGKNTMNGAEQHQMSRGAFDAFGLAP